MKKISSNAAALLVLLLVIGCVDPTITRYNYAQGSAADVRPAKVDLVSTLEGCSTVADDGRYLGRITASNSDPESIFNKFGSYGSKSSATSVFNEFGTYGGKFSALSPFNELTGTPPKIISADRKVIGYLTVNKLKTPCFDPWTLVGSN